MSTLNRLKKPTRIILAVACGLCLAGVAWAGNNNNNNNNNPFGFGGNNVGGITFDAQGVVKDGQRQVSDQLGKLRGDIPDGFGEGLELRKISLRDLQTAIVAARNNGEGGNLPQSLLFMGGLQRIQYVFVYPDDHDIVLAGPGEGWQLDDWGNAVGVTTGKPAVRLDHFLAALQTAFKPGQEVISCSIDPTADGIQRMRAFVKEISGDTRASSNPDRVAREIEKRLGPQTITLTGIDPTTHFAGVLVAADYRMKRLAMGLEAAPIKGLPSYLDMVSNPRKSNMMPRWWIEDDYEPLATDADGLSWELRGRGVKVLTEDNLVKDDGSRESTGKVSTTAQKWADNMTEKYDDLSAKLPVFGELRNCIDASVIGALIVGEQLHEKAGLDLGHLLDSDFLPLGQMNVPKQVPSQVSYRRTRRHLVITASGGVQVKSWQAAQRREKSDKLVASRDDAIAPAGAEWWWD